MLYGQSRFAKPKIDRLGIVHDNLWVRFFTIVYVCIFFTEQNTTLYIRLDNSMKRLVLILVLSSLISSSIHAQDPQPGTAGVGDPLFSHLGNGGYDVQHYTLDLIWDNETGAINGTVIISALATQDLSQFNLDFRGFEIEELIVNGVEATFSREAVELSIVPNSFLEVDESFIVSVTYSGIPEPVYEDSERTGWTTLRNGAYAVNEPGGASGWYPVNDHPTDKATYTFRITAPKPFVVATNGLLQEEIDNGETTTYVWEASDPIASYLTMVAIHEFVVQTEEGPGGLPIRNYFPADRVERLAETAAVTTEMMEFFIERFGPYPFEAYGIVVMPGFNNALETQTLSILGSGLVFEPVIAHELAHQWFGNHVSPATWQDIWLIEGIATFAEDLWQEHVGMPGRLPTYDRVRNLPPPGTVTVDSMFSNSVYLRGGWTLKALQAQVGDDTVFEILRTFHEQFAGGVASTEDFIVVAEAVSGEDLEAFFQGWLFDDEPPPLP